MQSCKVHERSIRVLSAPNDKSSETGDQLQTFGDWLKTARKRAGYTQVDIAKLLCVSSRTVSQWERGKQTPAGPYAIAGIKGLLRAYLSHNASRRRRVRRSGCASRKKPVSVQNEKDESLELNKKSHSSVSNLMHDLGDTKEDVQRVKRLAASPSTAFNAQETEQPTISLKFGN